MIIIIMQIKSSPTAKALNEVLEGPYHDEKICLKILTSFLDPENHAIERPEPPIPYNFTPDDGVYPAEQPGQANIDSVYELFTVLDENGKIQILEIKYFILSVFLQMNFYASYVIPLLM